jgi:hypothetical protein
MENYFLPKTNFSFKSYDKKLVFFAKNGQLLSMLGIWELGIWEKIFSFPIHAVNFCKKNCTCLPSNLGQDLKVKNTTKK